MMIAKRKTRMDKQAKPKKHKLGIKIRTHIKAGNFVPSDTGDAGTNGDIELFG